MGRHKTQTLATAIAARRKNPMQDHNAFVDSLKAADFDVLATHCRPTKRSLATHVAAAFLSKYRRSA